MLWNRNRAGDGYGQGHGKGSLFEPQTLIDSHYQLAHLTGGYLCGVGGDIGSNPMQAVQLFNFKNGYAMENYYKVYMTYYPYSNLIYFNNKYSSVKLDDGKEKGFYMRALNTEKNKLNKGYATSLLKEVVAFAAKNKVNVYAHVGKYASYGLENDRLLEFYKSFGFVEVDFMPTITYTFTRFKKIKYEGLKT